MRIVGLKQMSVKELNRELRDGARFVTYGYAISLLVVTITGKSPVYFLSSQRTGFPQGLPYSLVTFMFGWWGIPWGPIRTIETIANNCTGGLDVTDEVRRELREMFRYE